MDVSSFMGGNFLTHLDLPAPSQVWQVREVKQELVGTDNKIVVYFAEHQKGLGLNKVNLRTIVPAYSVQSTSWIGRPLELYKDQTQFQGRVVPCIRLRIPPSPPGASQQPVSPPAPRQPVTSPWEGQNNSPPAV